MGGRNSKVTVVQTGGGELPSTDAATLNTLGSEYASSKCRTSGRVAWDFQEYSINNKERNSDEVYLADRDSNRERESPTSSAGATSTRTSGCGSDKKIRAQAFTGNGEHLASRQTAPASLVETTGTDASRPQQPVVGAVRAFGDTNKVTTRGPVGAQQQSTSPTAAYGDDSSISPDKLKRPASGIPKDPRHKRNGRTQMSPPAPAAAALGQTAATPPGTAAAAAAAGGTAGAAACMGAAAPAATAAAAAAAATPASPAVPPAAAAATAAATGGSPQAAAAAAGAAADRPSSQNPANASVQWVIRPGPPIESHYRLGKVLGQGSFGVVRAATHIATGVEVAVKTIRKSQLRAADVVSLRREVEILHHLAGHPHISQLLGVYEEPRQLHLVIELYKGGDLFDAIIGCGRHTERTAADVMRTVLSAIAFCHAMGVAHRDIKPENFMLTAELPKDFVDKHAAAAAAAGQQKSSGGTSARQIPLAAPLVGIGARLKLIDFGLSAFCTDDTPLTEIVGTSYYVAPEVLEGRYSLAADVWSAGVILHIMLTGYAPFDGKDDREILRAVRRGKLDLTVDPVWTSISSEASAVLLAMLERDPKKRATADQVLSMPWLGRTADACEAPSVPLPGVVSDRLSRFARLSSFAKEARRVVAGLMRPEEVAGLVAQFQGLDADRDGRISLSELREGLARAMQLRGGGGSVPGGSMPGGGGGGGGAPARPLSEDQLRELLRRSDLNGDGLLDESEFLAAALPAAALARQMAAGAGASRPASSASRREPSAICAAFKHFDVDGSGYITADELRAALAAHASAGKGLDVEALLSRHDRDADGRISYPEFVDMLVQDVDDDDDDGDEFALFDPPRQSTRPPQRQQQPSPPPPPPAAAAAPSQRPGSSVRFNVSTSGGGGAAAAAAPPAAPAYGTCRSARRQGSMTAWEGGVSGGGAAAAAAAAVAAAADATAAAGMGRGPSRAVSRSSTVAAQMPSGHMSPLEWSDECLDSESDAAAGSSPITPAADAVLLVASSRTVDSMTGSMAAAAAPGGYARVPSRLSQPQLLHPTAPPPRLTSRCASGGGGGGNNSRSAAGGVSPTSVDNAELCSSPLRRLDEMPDAVLYDTKPFGGGGGGAAAAAAAAPGSPGGRLGFRAPPPPRLQLPAQPAADMRCRRHSAGGTIPDGRTLLSATAAAAAAAAPTSADGGIAGSSAGGGSPMLTRVDSRALPAAASRRNPGSRGTTQPGTPTDPAGHGCALADLQSPARMVAVGGAVGGGAASVPCSPSAAAAAAAGQRVSYTRLSTGMSQPPAAAAAQPPPPQLYQRPPAVQVQGLLPSLQTMPAGAMPPLDRLTERASAPQTSVGWPMSPGGGGGGGGAAAVPRPSRVSVTGMISARNPAPWPGGAAPAGAAVAAAATGPPPAGISAVTAAAAANLRPAPPSEPLPVLHTMGMRSRRQSTGSPAAWPQMLTPAGAVASPPVSALYPTQPHPQAHQHLQHCHSYSRSSHGAVGGGVVGSNALSPRVPAAAAAATAAADWSGGGPAVAGRRSRRATQPGVVQAPPMMHVGGDELILTSRVSVDLDAVVAGAASSSAAAGRGGTAMFCSEEDIMSLGHALPPGATGAGLGALPYRPLMTSMSGRLL